MAITPPVTFWKNWGHVLVNIGFAAMCGYGVLYIQRQIDMSLRSYVTVERYERDWAEYKAWSEKQVTRIESQFSDIRNHQEQSRSKLDTLLSDVRVFGSELTALNRKFDKLENRLGGAAPRTNGFAAFE